MDGKIIPITKYIKKDTVIRECDLDDAFFDIAERVRDMRVCGVYIGVVELSEEDEEVLHCDMLAVNDVKAESLVDLVLSCINEIRDDMDKK